ncbi:MAG: SDR family NAD(P)-dependent oxidoreductase [Lachnospiraceae bacterium]
MYKQSVLITGGAGFIGSNIALRLFEKGYKVRILDNLSAQIHGECKCLSTVLQGKVEHIYGDVRELKDWKRAVEGMDAIIHLAAETGTGQSMYEIDRYCGVNVGGTAKMLDVLTNEKHSVKKVIVAASRALYGEGAYICREHGMVYPTARSDAHMAKGDFEVKCPVCGKNVKLTETDENAKKHPTSVYGITKQMQEELVLTVCKAINIAAVAYRYQNVYGPGQSLTNPYTGILSIFSNQILNNQPINIFEDGKESRDFVYIDDVVDATIAGLESDVSDECFNIGSGTSMTVEEVVSELQDAYGKNVEVYISGNYRIGDIRHNVADISKAEKMLGYKPKVSFRDGIRQFASWVEMQGKVSSRYQESLDEMKKKGLFK